MYTFFQLLNISKKNNYEIKGVIKKKASIEEACRYRDDASNDIKRTHSTLSKNSDTICQLPWGRQRR